MGGWGRKALTSRRAGFLWGLGVGGLGLVLFGFFPPDSLCERAPKS